MTRIVVGVDRSPESRDALRWAFRESRLRDASLEVVLAWGYLDQYRGRARFEPFYDGNAACRGLDELIADTLPDAAAGVVKPVVVDGFAEETLLDAASGADLLVLGPRGTGGFLGFRLGSVSERCVAEAPCPVAVVRPGRTRPADEAEHVVVAVDGSDGGQHAVGWAVDEAARRKARLTVLHAWIDPSPRSPYTSSAIDAGVFEAAARRAVDRALDVDGLDLSVLPEPPERTVVYGAAGAVLTDASADADLLVVGSRGLSRFKRVLVGSVATEVVRHAACPVVVVRHRLPPE
jgi:nucleotide-binding universal stress UspA family protein